MNRSKTTILHVKIHVQTMGNQAASPGFNNNLETQRSNHGKNKELCQQTEKLQKRHYTVNSGACVTSRVQNDHSVAKKSRKRFWSRKSDRPGQDPTALELETGFNGTSEPTEQRNNVYHAEATDITTMSDARSQSVPERQSTRQNDGLQDEDFLAYGIDYLPDFEKRSERRRRKRKVHRILNVDFNWSASYLQLLARARAHIRTSADSSGICMSTRRTSAISSTSIGTTAVSSKVSDPAHTSRSCAKSGNVCAHADTLTDSKTCRPTITNGLISSNSKPQIYCDTPALPEADLTQAINTQSQAFKTTNETTNCCNGRVGCLKTTLNEVAVQVIESVDHASIESLDDIKEEKTSEQHPNGQLHTNNQVLSRASTVDSGIDVVTTTADWKTFGDYPFENVVMSGGGSKGYAYIGSLKALEDCGVLTNVHRIAGSSAGAICAGLLAVGCTPQEIADVFKCDIKWLFHDQPCACCCLPRVCGKYGLHPARRFYEIYGDHIANKVGNPDITFGELLRDHGRELCIVVTNISRMCSEYCNPTMTPDLPIRDAVRMSMAFPVVFRAVRYNECLYSDGGILDQYPVHCFDEPKEEVNQNKPQLEDSPFNDKTLGLYVVSEKAIDYKIWMTLFAQEIPYKPTYLPNTKLARNRLKHELSARKRQNKGFSKKEYMDELRASVGDAVEMWDHYEVMNKSHVDISNFGEYFMAAIETLLISQRKLHVKPSDVNRTVAINCGYIGTNDYVIEAGDREFMINQGYVCTQRFLQEFVKQRSHGNQPVSDHVQHLVEQQALLSLN